MGGDRRMGDTLIKLILLLLGLLQTIITCWAYNISNKVDENTQRGIETRMKVDAMAPTLEEVRQDVKKLLARR